MRGIWIGLLAAGCLVASGANVKDLNIRVLSTMLADDDGVGEWGFAALVNVDGRKILFDTGARPQTVLANARELKVDLTGVTDVILSHNHGDHTGGLMTLRRDAMARNPKSLSIAHVGKGIFLNRPGGRLAELKSAYEGTGARFIEYAKPMEIMPGVWLTGPVPRKYPERNWSGNAKVETDQGWIEDTIPEDMSMVFQTAQGLVVLSGCGHAGVINTIEYARDAIAKTPVHALIGGFHLFALDDDRLAWTAGKLKEFGVAQFMGAHCTGIEATYRIRQLNGMTRQSAAVAAVGATFDLRSGMKPGSISR